MPRPYRRSRGWMPLRYPQWAVLDRAGGSGVGNERGRTLSAGDGGDSSDALNSFFPLHKAVLQAAARELLILDETLLPSLQVNEMSVPLQRCSSSKWVDTEGPKYQVHAAPDRFRLDSSPSRTIVHLGKKRLRTGAPVSTKGKRRKDPVRPARDRKADAIKDSTESLDDIASKLTAEALVDTILQRAIYPAATNDGSKGTLSCLSDSSDVLDATCSGSNRKMSDALDIIVAAHNDSVDIARVVDLENTDGYALLAQLGCCKLPDFLEASIDTEAKLRQRARVLLQRLLTSFDNATLRLVFGYRSSSNNTLMVDHHHRDDLEHAFADLCFDVSHAMYAWQQTQSESTSSSSPPATTSSSDADIASTLFDAPRALRRIGGVGPSSLLQHALSIARLSTTSIEPVVGWAEWSKTAEGAMLLRHHVNEQRQLAAGQARRGQRFRHSKSSKGGSSTMDGGESDTVSLRARAASIVSTDESWTDYYEPLLDPTLAIVPAATLVHLSVQRPPGTSWGVLLAKESSLCVVVRGAGALRNGDIVLHVRGQRDHTPASNVSDQDDFVAVVDKFRRHDQLDVVVQRVA